MLNVTEANRGENLEAARGLLEGYSGWLESEGYVFPEESQAFREQLADLPACFAPPQGRLLIAAHGGQPAGCVALRKLSDGVCEMKRLYVKQQFWGLGIGRALAEAVIGEAEQVGYTHMRVHTFASMKAANGLYVSLGFREIEPYEYTPREEAVFMELKLM